MYPLQVLFAQLVQHGKNGLLDYFIHGRILLSGMIISPYIPFVWFSVTISNILEINFR